MFEGGILGILFTSLQVYVFVGTEYKNLTEVHTGLIIDKHVAYIAL